MKQLKVRLKKWQYSREKRALWPELRRVIREINKQRKAGPGDDHTQEFLDGYEEALVTLSCRLLQLQHRKEDNK